MNNLIVDGVMMNNPITKQLQLDGGKSTTVVNFTILNQNGKNKSPINFEAWGPVGKDVMKFRSGDAVCVVGSVFAKEYNGKDGMAKSFTVMRASQVTGTVLPSENNAPEYNGYSGYNETSRQENYNQPRQAPQQNPYSPQSVTYQSRQEENIPF